jgi:hypothetical protein
MDRERFDDVQYRIVEDSEPPRPSRPFRARRWALGGAAALLLAGGVTGGASAVTNSAASKAKAAQERALPHNLQIITHGWHNCHRMHYGAAGVPPTGAE